MLETHIRCKFFLLLNNDIQKLLSTFPGFLKPLEKLNLSITCLESTQCYFQILDLGPGSKVNSSLCMVEMTVKADFHNRKVEV
jgi:hypothetical protein